MFDSKNRKVKIHAEDSTCSIHDVLRSIILIGLFGWGLLPSLSAWDSDDLGLWANGNVEIHLHLGLAPTYPDGLNPSSAAQQATAAWNEVMQNVTLVPIVESNVSRITDNGLNNVTFGTQVFGEELGEGVLAVTLIKSENRVRLETDVVVNSTQTWSSYRGPLREGSDDILRVLIHEFGHVMGLDHPDEAQQTVEALMNSYVSNIDSLMTDDRDGIGALYGFTALNPGRPPILISGVFDRSIELGQPLHVLPNVDGARPMAFQWFRNDQPLIDQTSIALDIPQLTRNDEGRYSVEITNAAGMTSGSFELSVTDPVAPIVVGQPRRTEGILDERLVLQFTVYGSDPKTYQWYLNGSPIEGASSPFYVISDLDDSDAGFYHVEVSNIAGMASSSTHEVIIKPLPEPQFSEWPLTPPAIVALNPGETFELGSGGGVGSTIFHQWYRNGVPVAGANTPWLRITHSAESPGEYVLVTTNPTGSANSQVYRVQNVDEGAPDNPVFPTIDPTTQNILVDDIFRDVRGDVILHSQLSNNIWLWNTQEGRFTRTIPLPMGVHRVSYLHDWDCLLFLHDDARISKLPLNGSGNELSEFIDAPSSAVEFGAAGEFLIVQKSTGSHSAYYSYDSIGNLRDSVSFIESSTDMVWNSAFKRLQFFAAGSNAIYTLPISNSGEIGTQNGRRFPGSGLGISPLVLSPDQSLLLTGGGIVLEALTLRLIRNLGFRFESAIWTQSGPITATTTTQGVAISLLNPSSFAETKRFTAPGHSPTLFGIPDGRIMAITTVKDRLVFSLLRENLEPVYQLSHRGVDQMATETSLTNLSTRVWIDEHPSPPLVAGFVVDGTEPITVLLRAIGPGLEPFGVNDVLRDPTITIYDAEGSEVAYNDDWSSNGLTDMARLFARLGAFTLADFSRDSALQTTLKPGPYTAHVAGRYGGAGNALLEVYEATPLKVDARLSNLSTRMPTGSGERAMISGFVITGNQSRSILVRGVGPSLGSYGVDDFLANPALELFQSGNLLGSNDNWAGAQETKDAARLVGAFPLDSDNSLDAAMLITLTAGVYTTQISNADGNDLGSALMEVYLMED